MRFSYSLSRNIFEAGVGSLVNKLHLSRRRDTLFFGDIFINYIKECEEAGYGEEMQKIGQKWMILSFNFFIPNVLKKLPPIIFLNNIVAKIWKNLGLLDEFHASKKDDLIQIKTKNEDITRVIGKNSFLPGLYMGVLNVLFNSEIKLVQFSQTKNQDYNKYVFSVEDRVYPKYESKKRSLYFKLNSHPSVKGFKLPDILKKGIFQLKENKIYFRKKILTPEEATLFHLIGGKNILLEKVPQISCNYFKEIVKESSKKEKLVLLKTLLQLMGWGLITIMPKENEIKIWIVNPPFGVQKEKDNWDFFIQTILGYLWTIDRNLKIKEIKTDKKLLVSYSV